MFTDLLRKKVYLWTKIRFLLYELSSLYVICFNIYETGDG